ncbi:MAG: type II toxin-antitoxin system prevent-host-death family antitoxin [Burkholderiaceae bacterium]
MHTPDRTLHDRLSIHGLLIRWPPVRIWHDLPTSLRFGQSAAACKQRQHSAARYSSVATIAARDAKNHFGEFLDSARREPVVVTKNATD